MSENYIREKLRLQLYKRLPEDLKDAMSSEEIADINWYLVEKYDIDESTLDTFVDLERDLLFGILPPEEFKERLTKGLGLKPEVTEALFQEVQKLIFDPTCLYQGEQDEQTAVLRRLLKQAEEIRWSLELLEKQKKGHTGESRQDDLLARQREALWAFRKADAQRAEPEVETLLAKQVAEFLYAEQETKADTRLKEARENYEGGQVSLRKVNLAHLLDEKQLWVQPKAPKADPMAELARSVEAASHAVIDLIRSVDALLWRRERRRERLKDLLTLPVLVLGLSLVMALKFIGWFFKFLMEMLKGEER